MAENNFRIEKESKRKNNVFAKLESLFGMKGLLDEGVPVKYLPYILYIFFLLLIYIGNSHLSEKSVRKINRLEAEVEDLRADYTTLKAEYMLSGKQSEVARKVSKMGLEESLEPPNKIKTTDE